jgi:hypothetical protein
MTDKELTNKLAKFDYTNLWLDYGVLTIEHLIAQEQEFDNCNDKNTEHYRYGTFRYYLSSKTKLSDIEFDNYLKLTMDDKDVFMAGSATADLFSMIDLTQFQFQKLCEVIGHFGKWTNKVVIRQVLLRELKQRELTADLFRKCIENGDSIVHEYILEIANIAQIQELAIKGKNKKIRNIATEKLKKLTRQKNCC